jgi:hypothetical protein
MRSGSIVAMAVLSLSVGAASCSRHPRTELGEAPGIELGEDVLALRRQAPLVVMATRVPGAQAYEIASSALPPDTSSVRCLFLGDRLGMIRVHLSDAAVARTSFEKLVAAYGKRLGPPSPRSVTQLEMDGLDDSVVWSRAGSAVVVGRRGSTEPDLVVALVSTDLLPVLAQR